MSTAEGAPVLRNRRRVSLHEPRCNASVPYLEGHNRGSSFSGKAFVDRPCGFAAAEQFVEYSSARRIEATDRCQDAALPFELSAEQFADDCDGRRRPHGDRLE